VRNKASTAGTRIPENRQTEPCGTEDRTKPYPELHFAISPIEPRPTNVASGITMMMKNGMPERTRVPSELTDYRGHGGNEDTENYHPDSDTIASSQRGTESGKLERPPKRIDSFALTARPEQSTVFSGQSLDPGRILPLGDRYTESPTGASHVSSSAESPPLSMKTHQTETSSIQTVDPRSVKPRDAGKSEASKDYIGAMSEEFWRNREPVYW
jgi:hypothetical protein